MVDQNFHYHRGAGLIELILAMTVFSLLVMGIGGIGLVNFRALDRADEYAKAQLLVDQTFEVLFNLEQKQWSTILYAQSGLTYSGGVWSLSGEGSSDSIDSYTRRIYFDPVCADVNNQMVTCPGLMIDAERIKATVEVVWQSSDGVNHTVSDAIFLSLWKYHLYEDDLSADWNAGSVNQTVVSALGDGDGSVSLGTF